MTAARELVNSGTTADLPSARYRRRSTQRVKRRPTHVVVLVLAILFWTFPLYWMLNTSFKTSSNIQSIVPSFLPVPFTLENYIDAIHKSLFLQALLNSITVALGTVLVSIAFGFLMATALTKFRFIGRRSILVFLLIAQMIPGTAILIPLFVTFRSLDLLNSLPGLALAYTAQALPFCIWVLRGFFYAIPSEVDDAARVDGAGNFRLLLSIYFPLLLPGLISASIFSFIAAWNDYIMALVFLQKDTSYTLPIWLVSFQSENGTDYGGLIAGSVIFTLPVAIFFVLIQRHLVTGMSAGAVKG